MIGYYNEDPIINPDEVEDWKWMGIDAVENMVLFQSSIQFGLKSF
jgi:isopentenyl-diphosphate delta-isomerase